MPASPLLRPTRGDGRQHPHAGEPIDERGRLRTRFGRRSLNGSPERLRQTDIGRQLHQGHIGKLSAGQCADVGEGQSGGGIEDPSRRFVVRGEVHSVPFGPQCAVGPDNACHPCSRPGRRAALHQRDVDPIAHDGPNVECVIDAQRRITRRCEAGARGLRTPRTTAALRRCGGNPMRSTNLRLVRDRTTIPAWEKCGAWR